MRLGFVSKKKKKPKSQTLQLNSEKVVSLITKMLLKTETMFGNSFCFLLSKTCFWKYK